MGDITAGGVTNRDAQRALLVTVIGKKLGQIINLVEERDPAVRVRIVARDFAWCVEAAKFVGLGQIHSFGLFVARRPRKVRSWDSCCHFDFLICFAFNIVN